MEMITSRPQERENPSSANSPNSSTNSNGVVTAQFNQPQPQTTPPVTPKPIPRSDNNPYPTTFVQADTTTFKQVVQMLTGSAKQATTQAQPDPSPSSKISIPPIKSTGQKKQAFKLYERRNSLKNGLIINPSSFNRGINPLPGFSPRQVLSPSILDFPSLVLSPVTPLIEDPFNKASPSTMGGNSSSEEDRAIAEKGFYLHPSPRGAASEPQLLPLFPVTSPRVSGSSS